MLWISLYICRLDYNFINIFELEIKYHLIYFIVLFVWNHQHYHHYRDCASTLSSLQRYMVAGKLAMNVFYFWRLNFGC